MITAPPDVIGRAFPTVAGLQPVRWQDDGLLCAPRAAPELASEARSICPLPMVHVGALSGLPSPPSAWIAGWYRRSSAHAPAPPGVRELIQADGEAFGPGSHPTTTLSLETLASLPAAPAVDVGCGSGLLAQAWARQHGQPVLAVDLDPRAIAQTRRSADLSGLAHLITAREAPIGGLVRDDLDGNVVLANIPRAAHDVLLRQVKALAIPAAILSGLRHGEGAALVAAYRREGLRPIGAARAGRWERWTLVRA